MNEIVISKATVTGKRQITIPLQICKMLNIEPGQKVIFKKEGDRIFMESEINEEECFACKGTGAIDDNKCFVCEGKGKLNTDETSDIYRLIGNLSMNIRKYDLSLFLNQQKKNNNVPTLRNIPIITLFSEKISQKELLRVQDEFQKRIILYSYPVLGKHELTANVPQDTQEEIFNILSTAAAKEEAKKWFKPQNTR